MGPGEKNSKTIINNDDDDDESIDNIIYTASKAHTKIQYLSSVVKHTNIHGIVTNKIIISIDTYLHVLFQFGLLGDQGLKFFYALNEQLFILGNLLFYIFGKFLYGL